MKYHSHRDSVKGYWETSLPVSAGDTVDQCKKRTLRYLGYITDFFIVDTESKQIVYVYDRKKDSP